MSSGGSFGGGIIRSRDLKWFAQGRGQSGYCGATSGARQSSRDVWYAFAIVECHAIGRNCYDVEIVLKD